MRRLLSSQTSKHKETKEYCLRRLNHFSSKEKLELHEEYCSRNEAVRIEMPDKCSLFKFKNQNRSMRVPFEVSADSESSTEAIGGCEPSSDMSFTNQYQNKNHVGYAITSSASMISFILKSQSSIGQTERMTMLLRFLLKCLRRTSKIFMRNLI